MEYVILQHDHYWLIIQKLTPSDRYKSPRSMSFTMKDLRGKYNMFTKYGISTDIDPKFIQARK